MSAPTVEAGSACAGAAARRRTRWPTRLVAAFVLGVIGLGPRAGQSESALRLEPPLDPAALAATTFDASGRAVGRSSFSMEVDADGVHTMTVTLAVEAGGRNVSQATLEPLPAAAQATGEARAPGGEAAEAPRLRLVEQRSRATRADGVPLDLLVIDHERRRVSCFPPAPSLTRADEDAARDGSTTPPAPDPAADLRLLGHARGRHLELPEQDRVVNVPIQMLFRPLVEGRVEELHFELAACKGEPVLHSMIAVRVPGADDGDALIEVRYGPDLGRAVAWLAARLLPRLSFWFDARDGRYVGHRMPLHRDGPEVWLLRRGVDPTRIGLR